jgi:chitin synthase
VFRVLPPESTSGSLANQKVVELTVKVFKVVAYLLTFVIVLSAGVISKGTVLFMTSQLKPGRTQEYCSRRKTRATLLLHHFTLLTENIYQQVKAEPSSHM